MGFFPENQPERPSVEAPSKDYYSKFYTLQIPAGPNAVAQRSIDAPRAGYVLAGIVAAGNTSAGGEQVPTGRNSGGRSVYVSVQGNTLRVETGSGEDSMAMYQGGAFAWLYYAKGQETPPLSTQ